MTAANFPRFMVEYFRHEGGFTDHPKDPGNWTGGKVGVGQLRGTNMGIAAHAHPDRDIRNLTKSEVSQIIRRQYWDRIWGDLLPSGPDVVTGDASVNSGPRRGVRWMQAAAGMPKAARDGIMGSITLGAVTRHPDHVALVKASCAQRMSFLRGLRHWRTFKGGWSKRVARVEAIGVSLVPAVGRHQLEVEAEAAKQTAKRQGQGAGGVAAGSGGAGSSIAVFDLPPEVIGVIVALLVVGVVILLIKARHNRNRAAAYTAVAAEQEAENATG